MNKKHLLILATSLLLLVAGIGVGAYLVYDRFFTPAFNIAGTARLYIDRDDTMDSVRHKVDEVLSPHSIKAFNLLADYEEFTEVQAGSYTFAPTDNLRAAVRRLKLGWQTPVRIVVPSVRTLDRLAQSLSN